MRFPKGSDGYFFTALTCLQVKVLAEALGNIDGPMTQAKLIAALEKVDPVPTTAGPEGTFGPEQARRRQQRVRRPVLGGDRHVEADRRHGEADRGAMTAPAIEAQGIDVAYGRVQVLFDVDVVVEQGETLALLGTNGAGKSTLLRAITGLVPTTGGALRIAGQDAGVAVDRAARAARPRSPPGRRGDVRAADHARRTSRRPRAATAPTTPGGGWPRPSTCSPSSTSCVAHRPGRCRAARSRCSPWRWPSCTSRRSC